MRKLIILVLIVLCNGCANINSIITEAPEGRARAVVFDIDGTLTPTVMKYTKVRSDAAKAAHIYANMGYKIIYLSARFPVLQSGIINWLDENGFPDGDIQVIETSKYFNSHAKFKEAILRKYQAKGWKVSFAYGDSSTDFEAYAKVGIPKERVFALRRVGDHKCQSGIWKACLKGWNEHVNSIKKLVVACQEADSTLSASC